MPLDPTIPLGITPQASAASNPLEVMGKFATIQNAVNQNKLFQQTFAARQLAGQIMSSAPDMETGLKQIMKSEAAPFMGEFATQARQVALTELQMQKTQQEIAQSGVSFAGKLGFPAGIENPAMLDPNLMAGLRTVPEASQKIVLGAINDIRSSLFDKLPSDLSKWSEQDQALWKKRLVAQSIAVGKTPEEVAAIAGKPGSITAGNRIVPTLEMPGQAPFQAGQDINIGAPPGEVKGPGGTVTFRGGITPTGQVMGGTGGGLALPSTGQPGGNALGVQPAPAPGTPAALPISGIGKPIVAPPMSASTRLDHLGNPILSEGENDENSARIKEYGGKGHDQYDAAQKVLAQTQAVDNALDSLVKTSQEQGKSGELLKESQFLSPGTFGEQRLGFARAMNTIAGMMNKEPWFNTSKVAEAESLIKNSKQLGFSTVSSYFGQGREPLGMLENANKAVPGIENTYLGGKLVNASITAMTQRVVDQRRFFDDWLLKRKGNSNGMDAAFDEQYPVKEYMGQVFKKFGLQSDGGKWESPGAVENAVRMGWITPQMGLSAIKEQFAGKLK